MADPADNPPRAPGPGKPGQPLPRLRYTPPAEAEPVADADPATKPSGKGKGNRDSTPPAELPRRGKKGENPERVGQSEKKTVLREQTPTFDTFEGRQRTRIVVGLGLIAVLVVSGMLFARLFRTDDFADYEGVAYDIPFQVAPPAADPRALEREAALALADARAAAEQGRAELTLQRLDTIVETYPNTTAGVEANEALERGRQGLPLFLNAPLVIADLAEPVAAPRVEVDATDATIPPVAPGGVAEVRLAPPPVPPEPRRTPGMLLETADIAPKRLPDGFRPRPDVGVHPTGWPLEITCDHDGSALMLIPGGTFTMGRDDGPPEERPAHQVQLSPYYIDQHEVTFRQYQMFQDATGTTQGGPPSDEAVHPDLPVTHVSAEDARAYLAWAGKALPTEAQWEMAARTTDGRNHPWGSVAPSWATSREAGQIDPVMSFDLDMSPYGVFDLAGNVREWTADWFNPTFYAEFRDTTAIDPRGPGPGRGRIPLLTIKGSSPDWLVSKRDGMRPDARLPDLGFRGVLTVDRTATPSRTLADQPRMPRAPLEASAPRARPAQFPPGTLPF